MNFSDRSVGTWIIALTLVLNFRSKTMNPVTWWPMWDAGWDWSFGWYRVSPGLGCIQAEKGCQYVVLGRQFTSVYACRVCGFDVKLRGGAWIQSQCGWQKVCRDGEARGWVRRLELSDKDNMDSGVDLDLSPPASCVPTSPCPRGYPKHLPGPAISYLTKAIDNTGTDSRSGIGDWIKGAPSSYTPYGTKTFRKTMPSRVGTCNPYFFHITPSYSP